MSSSANQASPALRGALFHLGILGVAVVTAAVVWTRDKQPKSIAAGDVTVWSGRQADVERIGYENKTKTIALSVHKDEVGRYFVGSIEKSAPAPASSASAGAPPPAPKTTTTIVSVAAADKLADALAPLKALRALGKIGDDRASEFGLAEPDATVSVKIGASERKLLLGGPTPGSGDRYVKDPTSGEVFAVRGEPFRTLESADTTMVERDLHEWKDTEVQTATLTAGSKSRAIVRGGVEGKRFWADAASPETNDETLGNWMSKLDRLRPTEFLAEPPAEKQAVLRIEYAGGKSLGFIELSRTPAGDNGKPTYLIRTERTRLYAKVPLPAAEPVEQDLGAVVK
ncbi:MAG: DUF4340 domain-containing protein [Byssovorax sp.]